uniref:Uncharacterized protein n=1 Tax=Fibrocapsa japonica TaxID=94617 RepID=A0A7S2V5X2_9STRA|mmetsp:Transcript_4237/g.6327  ORF Transcript_4237/g.6327 Transcript_4237/m.6327 type:complete len:257 (+) Transcript_4237:131-901(+)
MEEFDDLIQHPDDKGCLDLAHRGWVTLDDAVWTMNYELFILNISFNNITAVPPRIGDLNLLRELDCSSNKIETIPNELGECRRLRRLKCNGNRIKVLPETLENCPLLEEITASENEIEEVPGSLGRIPALKILRLQNNRLRTLPPELGDLLTLEEINVSGNPELRTIPKELQDNTQLIVWICALHKDHRDRMRQLEQANYELENQARFMTESKMILLDNIGKLKSKNEELQEQMPDTYLHYKAKALEAKSRMCAIS